MPLRWTVSLAACPASPHPGARPDRPCRRRCPDHRRRPRRGRWFASGDNVAALAHLAFESLELWLLEWRGTATVCTVLEVRQRESIESGGGQAPQYYDYRMDCATVDAPQAMTTHLPVPGDRIAVAHDPDRLVGARAGVEVQAAAPRAGIAGLAVAAWSVLTLSCFTRRTTATDPG